MGFIERLQIKDRLIKQIRGNHLEVSIPLWIHTRPLGGLKICLSLEKIRSEITLVKTLLSKIGRTGLNQIIVSVVLTTLVLVVIGLGLSIFVAGHLIRPIQEVSRYAKQLGKGDDTKPIFSKREDEIGDLIKAFNEMSQDLKHTTVSKNYLESILSSMRDSLVVLSPEGVVTRINSAICNMLGYEESELIDQPIACLFPEENMPDIKQWLTDLMKHHAMTHTDQAYVTKSGKTIPVSLSWSAITKANGTVVGLVCVAQDITERQRIFELTAAAKEAAEQANAAKSEFLANMSHEIRTPMNGVLGMAELLLATPLSEEQLQFAEAIKNSGTSLLTIINDILDFSKIEAGKLELECIDFDLKQLIEDVIRLLGTQADSKKLELKSFIQPETHFFLRGDPTRLRQVLINLIGNAIKFTAEGTVELKISTTRMDQEIHNLNISIIDTGVGIDEKVRTELFSAFSQADGSTTRKYGGTGLGLAISRELVLLMGGNLDYKSRVGKGTEFFFTLTMKEGHSALEEKVGSLPSEINQSRVEDSKIFKTHVLLAEDNEVNQILAMAILQNFGCRVSLAVNGVQAVDAFLEETPDLILMDCQMPEMDGFQATDEIRRQEEKMKVETPIPIIALTANALEGDKEKCLAAGMNDYLSKPFKSDELYMILERWFLPDQRVDINRDMESP